MEGHAARDVQTRRHEAGDHQARDVEPAERAAEGAEAALDGVGPDALGGACGADVFRLGLADDDQRDVALERPALGAGAGRRLNDRRLILAVLRPAHDPEHRTSALWASTSDIEYG